MHVACLLGPTYCGKHHLAIAAAVDHMEIDSECLTRRMEGSIAREGT